MTRYIARYSYKTPIQKKVKELDAQNLANKKLTGKGKITFSVPNGLLIDEDGITLRNNTVMNQITQLSKNVLSALKDSEDSWYWEVTLYSLRYTRVGYCIDDHQVVGLNLPDLVLNETFGFLFDRKERKFKVFNKQGLLETISLLEKFKFSPCIEIAPLQQVTFNFGKPTLEKQTVKLFSGLQCADIEKPYTCDEKTFRQEVVLPFMQREYFLEDGGGKKKNSPLQLFNKRESQFLRP